MTRFLYCKEGSAVWISHLDLLRMFQRAFRRADIEIALTAGFNPHAYVSIALPLSVGMQSQCEILECKLSNASLSPSEAVERLNGAGFPEGIRILEGYTSERKFRELKRLRAAISLIYDQKVPSGAAERIRALYQGESLLVEKHSKNGMVETDIRSLLCESTVCQTDEHTIDAEVLVCAGEPSLNPELLVRAMERHLPTDAPDFSVIRRLEVYDAVGAVFR